MPTFLNRSSNLQAILLVLSGLAPSAFATLGSEGSEGSEGGDIEVEIAEIEGESTQTPPARATRMGSDRDGFDSPIEGVLQAAAQNGPQRAIAELVEEICPAGISRGVIRTQDLQDRCTDVVRAVQALDATNSRSGPTTQALEAVQDLAAEEVNAIGSTEVDSSSGQMDAIGSRLATLRAGGPRVAIATPGFDGSKVAAASTKGWLTGGGAGDEMARKLGFFVNGNYVYNDKDATSNESGFQADAYGVTAGLDYQITDPLLVGAAFTYTTSDTDIALNGGNMETDTYGGFGYATLAFGGNWYLDGMVGYTQNNHDQTRNLNYTVLGVALNQTALSELDSREVAGSVKIGFDNTMGAWVVSPYARVDVADVEIDGYSERMSNLTAVGSGVALQIDDQSYTSLMSAFGAQLGYVSVQSWGTWYPQVVAEYVHEFDNDAKNITGRFVNAPTFSFSMPIDNPDRNFGNIGVTSSFLFNGGVSAFASFQTLVGYEDLTTHAVEFGVRIPF
ncbi:MAG: autotransporter outer membrane beta-barrel domain-containing protein [Gammaproteobacteria bacterium]|nr:autotransporter outer membrane beta-barrel domain-containing protein [Gammaproteobacteria bacterium]